MKRRSIDHRRLVVAVAVVAALGGCGKEPIKVLDPDTTEGGDFGRAELLAAVDRFRQTPNSAEAFAALRIEVNRLSDTFDATNKRLADRLLVFLALGPLEANVQRPQDEQIEILAATVWPHVLGPEPKKGEGGRAYLDRVCGDELAGECRHLVPEMRALFLGAKVWRRFRLRAQEHYSACRPCQNDESYRLALRRYEELSFPLESEAANRKGDGHPGAWPRAGEAALAWEPIKTIEVDSSGELRVSGRVVSAKAWRKTLAEHHRDGDAVGLYLSPGASISMAREFVTDLASLGYGEIRLQVRAHPYPYTLGYFPLAGRRRAGVDIGLRSTDTVQVAVLAMEEAVGRGATLVSIF